ncbi:MAG: right-handed parallel beta-helix repeat-containing protein, partial [Candidatus Hodarchaeales archaeon]
GFELDNSDYNTFINNDARNNSQNGYRLETSSDFNTFNFNTAINNSLDGFVVTTESNNNTYIDNYAFNNSQNGFTLSELNTDYNTLINNFASNNSQNGFYLPHYSQYNTLINNSAFFNLLDGFNFDLYSSGHTLKGNKASNNGLNGFYFNDNDENILDNNYAINNSQYGIYMGLSGDFQVSNNYLYNNTDYGMYLYSSFYFRVYHNVFIKNNQEGKQAYDDSSYNYWARNYWSDYTDSDNDNDGMGDIPYWLPGFAHAEDMLPLVPTLFNSEDIIISQGTTGNTISWTSSYLYPVTYEIYINDNHDTTGTWLPKKVITVSGDGLELGVYNFTIIVTDINNKNVTDAVIVTVIDDAVPLINYSNSTNYDVSWIATDMHPSIYYIYQNNLEVNSGVWISGMVINYTFGGLIPGMYNFTIILKDDFGNMVSDTVILTIPEPLTPITVTNIITTTVVSEIISSTIVTETETANSTVILENTVTQTIQETTFCPEESDSQTPGFELILLAIGLVCFIIYRKK